jgi:hypothetical protein
MSCTLFYIYYTSVLCRMSRILVCIMVAYYRVKAILVILGVPLRLLIRGVGSNNLDYNIELACESY